MDRAPARVRAHIKVKYINQELSLKMVTLAVTLTTLELGKDGALTSEISKCRIKKSAVLSKAQFLLHRCWVKFKKCYLLIKKQKK